MDVSNSPQVRHPTEDQFRHVAEQYGLDLTRSELQTLHEAATLLLGAYDSLDEQPAREIAGRGTREPGSHTSAESDPLNAFIRTCSVPATENGTLSDLTVALKDNIAVAGIEMTCGLSVLQGYVPSSDAEIVQRLLGAGANVIGKTNMDPLGVSSTGGASDFGPVLNPNNMQYLAGGSSSGSAAAVARKDVDIGIGTDGGGSVRIPAAWCGCVGYKPTHGIVPATGLAPLTFTFDHVGPITRTVERCITVMDAIAGPDPEDPLQRAQRSVSYTADVPERQLTIGVLTEGFDRRMSDEAVDQTVRDAIDDLSRAGLEAVEVSIPEHRDSSAAFLAVMVEEVARVFGNSGHRFDGSTFDIQFPDVFGRIVEARGEELPEMLLTEILLGEYLATRYNGRFEAIGRQRRRDIVEAYETALGEVDVLALPTTPMTPVEAGEDCPLVDSIRLDGAVIGNTSPFNLTGHPAISVPCGNVDGLPVGLQLVGSWFEDQTVLSVALEYARLTGAT